MLSCMLLNKLQDILGMTDIISLPGELLVLEQSV